MKIIATFIFIILGPCASARVFDLKDETWAMYVRGTFGPSVLNQDPFGNSSGSDSAIDKHFKYNAGADFGTVIRLVPHFSFRVGVEGLEALPISGAIVRSSTGVERFTLNSSVYAINPYGAIEVSFKATDIYKLFVYAGAGYAIVNMQNQYTAQSTSDLNLASYNESSQAITFSGILGLTGELFFTDTTTFLFDVAYRYLPVQNLKYKNSGVGNQGSFFSGQSVTNDDLSRRSLDLSGLTVGVGFRFYIR